MLFEYHQKLHHSQTSSLSEVKHGEFEYHQKLHHSQTIPHIKGVQRKFEYHQKLHHSQTGGGVNSSVAVV